MSSNQVVMVTGASTGFGRLISEALARKGHTVFATMRDPAVRNAKNASEIRALAGKENLKLEVLELDVTDESSVERAVHACVGQAGRIDVAINNAGYVVIGLEEATTADQVKQIFDTNFLGCVRVNRAVLPHMRKQRSGLLLHVSSGAGRLVFPGFGFYCATKFAMEAMAETYRYELAGLGIESCILEPGAYNTPIFGSLVKAADEARAAGYGATAEIPAKLNAALTTVAGNPQDIADVVLTIVETPAGERQPRYRVGSRMGIDEINTLTEKVQGQLLQGLGLAEYTKFVKSAVAGAD